MQQDNFTKYNDYYLVRSLYFDNYFFSHFHEKIDGVKNRHKFRIRTYAENEKKNTNFFRNEGKKQLKNF